MIYASQERAKRTLMAWPEQQRYFENTESSIIEPYSSWEIPVNISEDQSSSMHYRSPSQKIIKRDYIHVEDHDIDAQVITVKNNNKHTFSKVYQEANVVGFGRKVNICEQCGF